MVWIRRGGKELARRPARLSLLAGLLIAAVSVASAAPADASRKPTRSEARAIKRAFLDDREVKTAVRGIRVSTADPSFAAVTYAVTVPEPTASRLAVADRAKGAVRSPVPTILEERKNGKWKPAPKPPKKVKKDLKGKGRSDIRISGEAEAVLTRPAACTASDDFYDAGIYNPTTDVYLSVQIFTWTGFHAYPARGVHSVASLAIGNNAGVPQFETGQGNDAFSPSGVIYVDSEGWGIIEATMARLPDSGGTYPQSVGVSGYWVCR